MSEWWTYRLSDLLMFAPRTYHRLFELHNDAAWPLALVTPVLALALVVALARRAARAGAAACLALALAWLGVGVGFHARHFATINTAAPVFAAAFVVEGACWALLLPAARGSFWRWRGEPARRLGIGYGCAALALHPLLGALLGRPWGQTQWVGLAPDPTVLLTLAVLLQLAPAQGGTARRVLSFALWSVPLAWCAVGGAMLWAMQAPEAALMPLAGVLALGAAARERRLPLLPQG
jgi:hypothetical protein